MCSEKECYLCEVGYGYVANGHKGFSRGRYIPYKTVSIFAQERNNFSVFKTAYRYNRSDVDNADLYGDFYLDFDDEEDFEKVRADAITALSYLKICYHISDEYVSIYFSGCKGVHLIVPSYILGVEPTPILNQVYKHMAGSISSFTKYKTIDLQIYDSKRMFRIPNSIHEKTSLYKIPLTPDELRNSTIDEIREMARCSRTSHVLDYHLNSYAQQQFKRTIEEFYKYHKEINKDRRYKAVLNFTPPCIEYILEHGAVEGSRNITIACLSSFCKSSGKSLNETITFISEWNSRNVKPTGEKELERTVRSIFLGDKQFGCSTLKTISECNSSSCKLSQKGDNKNGKTVNRYQDKKAQT